jgi:hypothetical protein
MSTHTTKVTIGTKPLAAIVAEFAADVAKGPKPQPPDARPGWVEYSVLLKELNMSAGQFERHFYPRVRSGEYESGRGTKIGKLGTLCVTSYYRRAV